MYRHGILVWVLIVFVGTLVGCGGGKYSEVVEVNTQFVDAMEEYVEAVGKAGSAKDVARATDQYAARVEKYQSTVL